MDEGPPVTRPLMMGGEQAPPQQQQPGNSTAMGATYSVPGVLHFIKNEFVRFEKERANWEVERAELQAKISFLQGERKGHDNLMKDLVRRIKMLEFALKQERLKVLKMQHPGKELAFADMKPPHFEQEPMESHVPSLCNQQESRRILRDYLREVGFPDNVLEARVARINLYRTLTNSSSKDEDVSSQSVSSDGMPSEKKGPPPAVSAKEEAPLSGNSIPNGTDTEEHPGRKDTKVDSNDVRDNVEALLEKDFRFLEDEDSDDEDEEEWSGGQNMDAQNLFQGLDSNNPLDEASSGDLDMDTEVVTDEWESSFNPENTKPMTDSSGTGEDDREGGGGGGGGDWGSDYSHHVSRYRDHKRKNTKLSTRPTRGELEMLKNQANEISNTSPVPGDLGMGIMRMPGKSRKSEGEGMRRSPTSSRRAPHENIEVSLGIDDLAGLLISNEATTGYESSSTESARKWEHKFTMRSHFDVVTGVCFHPVESILISASEDCTLKLWNLQKALSQSKRSAIIDVEPLYTFRGHTSPVMSVALSTDGDVVYSGASDGSIRMWQVPVDLADPFDIYDAEVQRGVLEGHTDCVWGIVVHSSTGLLASCSADGRCVLWDPQLTSPKLREFPVEEDFGLPTSVDFLPVGVNQIVVSYSSAKTIIYDTETGKSVVNLDSAVTYDGTNKTQINQVVSHPTLPLLVTAHEDKYIRFFDSKSGSVIHSMTAHMDAVTGLAVDPHGLYLLSGSHDGSLRFWSMETKTCVQEITAHRKRFDESIYGVACHMTKPFFASAGADGIVKVFT